MMLNRRDAAKSAEIGSNVLKGKNPKAKVTIADEETPSVFFFPSIAGDLGHFRIPKVTNAPKGNREASAQSSSTQKVPRNRGSTPTSPNPPSCLRDLQLHSRCTPPAACAVEESCLPAARERRASRCTPPAACAVEESCLPAARERRASRCTPPAACAVEESCLAAARERRATVESDLHDSGVSSDEECDGFRDRDVSSGEELDRFQQMPVDNPPEDICSLSFAEEHHPPRGLLSDDGSGAPALTSVQWKPLSDFQLGSLDYISQRRKRKRRLSSSATKLRKRKIDKTVYATLGENIRNAKKRRYEASPKFVQSLVDRVHKYQLYANHTRYASKVKTRASEAVKHKYQICSPQRKRCIEKSLNNYRQRCKTPGGRCALRRQYQASYRKHAGSILARRKLVYRKSMARAGLTRNSTFPKEAGCAIPAARKPAIRSPGWYVKQKYLLQRRSSGMKLPPMKKDSAEHRAMKFRLWKRHSIRRIMAQTRLSFGPNEEARLIYQRKQADVTAKFDQVLNVQHDLRKQLYERCKKMAAVWTEADGAIGDLSLEDRLGYLRDFYGGEQFHVPSCKDETISASGIDYKPYADVFSANTEKLTTQKASLSVWPCDERCESLLKPDWPIVLHARLKLLNNNLRIQPLLQNVVNFEKCIGCTTKAYCSSASFCGDTIRYLLYLRPHYSGIRTLVRDVYRLRRIAFDLHLAELLLLRGSFEDMCSFCERYQDRREESASLIHSETNRTSDALVRSVYGNLISACELAIRDSMQIYPCYNCLKYVDCGSIKTIAAPDAMFSRPEIRRVVTKFEEYHGFSTKGIVQLCAACYTCFKNGKVSDFSFLNEMWPDKIPEELSCLNPYELQSISRAKCCQRILKLYPYKYRGPTGTLTRAVKGMALHLPLPTGTISHISSILEQKDVTFPDLSSFLIHVDSLPKLDTNVVLRSVYDHEVAKNAVRWLQKNNPLYYNVKINEQDVFRARVRFTNEMRKEDIETVDDTAASTGPTGDTSQTVADEPKLLPSKRRMKVDKVSYFDNDGSDATDSCIAEEHHTPGDASDCTTTETSLPGGAAAADLVKSMNYKIPFTIAYKRFFEKELRKRSSLYHHLPDADVLEEFSVIDMNPSLPKTGDIETFGTKPLLANPLRMTDPHIDVACFPHLYPYGTGGLFHNRPRIVQVAYFVEHRFKISDPRFRRCLPYLFDCALRKDEMAVNSSLFTMLSRKTVGSVTAGNIKNAVKRPKENIQLERSISTLMRQVGGTPQYWQRVRLDLEAFVEHFGKPTFFLTLSCAEYSQEDYRVLLEHRNADLPNVQHTSIRNLIAVDPVSVADHFERRFWAFFNTVLISEHGALGKVENYFVRKEYQQRGAPHMHVFLWVKDAPVHGKDSDEDVQSFNATHISCALPDPIDSPSLHQLVSKYQMHSCTKSCLRKKTVKGKFYSSYCRYGFPRKVTKSFGLNSLEDVLRAKASGQGRIKLYSLPRNSDEIMVNDYNPVLLQCWGSNVDLQYITDDAGCLSHYVTKYITKSEKQNPSSLAQAVNKELSEGGQLKSLACKLLSSRQLGSYEAADKVLRNPLYHLSREVKAAGFYYPGTERRRLKPLKAITELDDNSTDIFTNNFQDKFYPQRPKPLESLTAAEVLQQYEYRYGKPVRDKSLFMPDLGVYFAKRKEECVVRIWKSYGEGKEHLEQYAFQFLALFRPWRRYHDLLTGPDGAVYANYTEAYAALRDLLPSIQRHECYRTQVTKMIDWADGIQRQVQEELEENNQEMDILQVDPVQEIDLELSAQSMQIRAMLSQDMVDDTCSRLNANQKEAFDFIVGDSMSAPKRLFVSGVGGTGKSFLINTLRLYFEFNYSTPSGPSVLVAAPTGVAAANVNGVTIHRLLKLPVSKGNETGRLYYPLHPADLKILRILFSGVKLLIIDEVSMLSNLYLLFIHKRLNEILVDENRDPAARFGNLNVVLLGDLLQLPPVSAPHVFQYINRDQVKQSFRSIGCCLKLWSLFDFIELNINMRQKDDKRFTELLDRVRVGSPTPDDLAQLRSRLIMPEDKYSKMDWASILEAATDSYLNLLRENESCLCILPLNEAVQDFNAAVMRKLGFDVVYSRAVDVADAGMVAGAQSTNRKRSSKPRAIAKKKQPTTAQTGGLEENLMLAVGARVMLRRNLDVKQKLINGTIGVIEKIDDDVDTSTPAVVFVRFNTTDGVVPVKKVKSKCYVSGSLYVERSQFPLTLAYAITVHKCQGLSLNSAMIDLGPRTFSRGMAYVALSRVVKLGSVHLIRLDASKIACDANCAAEYSRLRQISGRNTD